jgi:hypothetical protein
MTEEQSGFPDVVLSALGKALETAKDDRDEDRDDGDSIREALDLSLHLLQWLASGGRRPRQFAERIDELRSENLPLIGTPEEGP